eukprot:scaffold3356_cov264-Pinguiococcus_pyrenoidosus.AAC.3
MVPAAAHVELQNRPKVLGIHVLQEESTYLRPLVVVRQDLVGAGVDDACNLLGAHVLLGKKVAQDRE